MSEPAVQMQAPANALHLIKKDYEGAQSTLCKGCGHDAITASIVTAAYEASVDPKRVIKLSGIGLTPNDLINSAAIGSPSGIQALRLFSSPTVLTGVLVNR